MYSFRCDTAVSGISNAVRILFMRFCELVKTWWGLFFVYTRLQRVSHRSGHTGDFRCILIHQNHCSRERWFYVRWKSPVCPLLSGPAKTVKESTTEKKWTRSSSPKNHLSFYKREFGADRSDTCKEPHEPPPVPNFLRPSRRRRAQKFATLTYLTTL